MNKIVFLTAVFLFVAACFAAQGGDSTSINFYFADMLNGVSGGGYSGSGGNHGGGSEQVNNVSNDGSDEDAYNVDQTIQAFFAENDAASNDAAANVVYSKYAPLLAPYTDPNVVLTTSSSIVNGGATTSYNGVAGVVQYLSVLSSTRSSSTQILSDLSFDFSDCSNTVTVSGVYKGIEALTSNSSYQTFWGHRSYGLTRDSSFAYGWRISSVDIVRDVTRPSPEWTATFRGDIQEVVIAYFNINDQASVDNVNNVNAANYGPLISPLITSDITVASYSPLTGNKTYGVAGDGTAAGLSAVVAYLHDVSGSRLDSQQALSSFSFSFNFDESEAVVNCKYSGWEKLTNGAYQTFYGTRSYTAVRGDDGVWRLSSATIIRSATFTATLAS